MGLMKSAAATIDFTHPEYEYENGAPIFQVADFNGDGLSDIIKIYNLFYERSDFVYHDNIIHIDLFLSGAARSYSKAIRLGSIRYIPVRDDVTTSLLDTFTTEIDGDGIPDLLITTTVLSKYNQLNTETIHIIRGKDIISDRSNEITVSDFLIPYTKKMPLFAAADFNNDSKDELIFIQDQRHDGMCHGVILHQDADSLVQEDIQFPLSSEPKKCFAADFNNDGLADLMILHEAGNIIYLNNGEDCFSAMVTRSPDIQSTFPIYHENIEAGDFNGDGLIDLIYPERVGIDCAIATNRGNGYFNFTLQQSILPQRAQNGKEKLIPYDLNNDGLCDFVLFRSNSGSDNKIFWVFNSQRGLMLAKEIALNNNAHTDGQSLMLGHFSHSGAMELANIGQDLTSSTNSGTSEMLRFYIACSPNDGLIEKISNGFHNKISILYSKQLQTDYNKNHFPIHCGGVPITTVSRLIMDNGAAGERTIDYSFKDLMWMSNGQGLLGFNQIQTFDLNADVRSIQTVMHRDPIWQFPTSERIETQNNVTEHMISRATTTEFGNISTDSLNYKFSPLKRTALDLDSLQTIETFNYTPSGMLKSHRTTYGTESMFKETVYDGFINVNGMDRPTIVIHKQKHIDDSEIYSKKQIITYNSCGLISSTVDLAETPKATITDYTYDVWGNIKQQTTSGNDIPPTTTLNEYDPTGRYLIAEYHLPEATITKYGLDQWGNILTITDATNADNELTTTFNRGSWGYVTKIQRPTGSIEEYGTAPGIGAIAYHTTTWGNDGSVMTISHDSEGRVVKEIANPHGNLRVCVDYEYDSKGNIIKRTVTRNGNKIITDFSYDNRNRLISEINTTTGVSQSYCYHPLQVIHTIEYSGLADPVTLTTEFDRWGNPIKYISSMGTITNLYDSNGQIKKIITPDMAVTMDYDVAGNCVNKNHSVAGVQQTTYNSNGDIIEHIDANGINTTYNYNSFGQLESMVSDNCCVTYQYGAYGYDNLKLTAVSDGYNRINYSHDRIGRVISEKRVTSDGRQLIFSYLYDDLSRPEAITYPDGTYVSYSYDATGHLKSIYADSVLVTEISEITDKVWNTSLLGGFSEQIAIDMYGFPQSKTITDSDGATLFRQDFSYNPATGSLLSRSEGITEPVTDTFVYDNTDRLIEAMYGQKPVLMSYLTNDNIEFKSDVGTYQYDPANKLSLKSDDNHRGAIPETTISTAFNDFGKIEQISDDNSGYVITFEYGPDQNKWKSVLTNDADTIRTISVH